MAETKIEWTDKTWNPVTGCSKQSDGCTHCYAEVMARRLKAMGQKKYVNGFKLTIHEDDLDEPYKWKGSHNVFVCSMADLFHKDVPFEFIDKVMNVIRNTSHNRYQILTKRAERMEEYFRHRIVPQNAWLGVTVENQKNKYRVDYLSKIEARIHFLSCEPLLEDLGEIKLDNIQWIIVGGESGSQARPMKKEWVLKIREQAMGNGIPFFFKQWGTWGQDGIKRNKKLNGKLLEGVVCQEMP
jgi:protein gp37